MNNNKKTITVREPWNDNEVYTYNIDALAELYGWPIELMEKVVAQETIDRGGEVLDGEPDVDD